MVKRDQPGPSPTNERMKNNQQKNILKFCSALIIIGGVISFVIFTPGCGPRGGETDEEDTTTTGTTGQVPRAHVQPPAFNADSAYHFVKTQVDMGPRNPGSRAHAQCASWLQKKLESYGGTVQIQTASIKTYDGKVWMNKNIIAEFNPAATDRILLCAHWDCRPMADHDSLPSNRNKPILGANDAASGVGVLLEVARAIAEKQPTVGIDIIFFDLEDYGDPDGLTEDSWCLGAQYWSKNPHKPQYFARFGILLDMVGAQGAVFPREGSSLYYARSVVDKVWTKAQSMGYGNYFINTETNPTTDDHVYINEFINIPTIDIVHYDAENRSYFKCHHKQCDDMRNIDKNTLEVVGKVLLEVIYNE